MSTEQFQVQEELGWVLLVVLKGNAAQNLPDQPRQNKQRTREKSKRLAVMGTVDFLYMQIVLVACTVVVAVIMSSTIRARVHHCSYTLRHH